MSKIPLLEKKSVIKTKLDRILTDSAQKAFENWANKRYTK